jgi:hypothetical protein
MISISQILQLCQTALVTDATFLTWCNTNLGAAPLVQIGEDAQDPVGGKDAPAVILVPGPDYPRGQEEESWRLAIGCDWIIKKEGVSVSGKAKAYLGLTTADAFGEQVLAALVRAVASSAVSLSRVGYSLDPILNYPYFEAGMDIEIEIPNVIGTEINL